MRTQRRTPLTVKLIHRGRTEDNGLGDYEETRTETTVVGATFEPERSLEQTSPDQAPVVQPAVFNIPGVHELDADDVIEVDGQSWEVVGHGEVWLDRTKVPVKQTREV